MKTRLEGKTLTIFANQCALLSSLEYKRLILAAFSQVANPALSELIESFTRSISTAMHLLTVTSILIASAGFCQSQPATTIVAANKPNHWCGQWAGSPKAADAPVSGQLPEPDYTRRFFAEPQLQRVPFSPIVATEPKVQIPKVWGNSTFPLSNLSVPVFIYTIPPAPMPQFL